VPAHSIHLNLAKENVLHINGGKGGGGFYPSGVKAKNKKLTLPLSMPLEISWTRSVNPLMINTGTGWSVVNITLRPLYLLEGNPVPSEQEDGLDQESVWTL
jgi:hypothetical protein